MVTAIAFLAFFVLLAVVSLTSLVADSRSYPRWRSDAAVEHVRPRIG
jgi:hypothetical protein